MQARTKNRRSGLLILLITSVLGSLLTTVYLPAAGRSRKDTVPDEEIWRHRNLGKAFYENPTTEAEAVGEFKKALDLDPESVRENLNYALALLRAHRSAEAVERLLSVQRRAPEIPHTWFNLGVHYRAAGEFAKAIGQFEHMIRLVPDEPKSRYNLGVLYKQAGRLAEAERELQLAVRLDPNLTAPRFQLYNLYRESDRKEAAAQQIKEFRRLRKAQEGAAVPEDMEWSDYAEIWDPIDMKAPPPAPEPKYEIRTAVSGLDPRTAGMLVLDSEAIGRADLLLWSGSGILLFRRGEAAAADVGLGNLKGVVSAAAGDFDNDGLPDLCILTEQRPLLFRNAGRRFEPVKAELPAARFEKAVWIDYDHDYDLDLLLLGAESKLLRNQGPAGFADRTSDCPFATGQAIDAAVTRVLADSRAFDVAVSYADRPGTLYRDKLGGLIEAQPLPELPAGARHLRAEDIDHDGWLDLIYHQGALLNAQGRFSAGSAGKAAGAALRADFDGDGRPDEARITEKGHLQLSLNRTKSDSGWLRVQLAGIKNLKLAYAAQVEVKAGTLYEKRIYDGVPLVFDLRGRSQADTVRISWPNGLMQNEIRQPGGHAYQYKEAQRLSGSCPMIWTWNGEGLQFITDVLGVAPLGASAGGGKFFPVDHDEYIQIPGSALKPENGQFEVRITEELAEVSYLDQAHLVAVDHPAHTEILTNDKWKSPPFPAFRLFGARTRVYPQSARDDAGRDVLSELLKRDRRYPSTFRHDRNGVAEMHSLTLDFGGAAGDGRAVLVLNGWVDWADGSTFLAAAQESNEGLVTPRLQARDAQGRWQTILEDMGMPAGKPKTIAVDLSGRFLSRSRELRITTNLCVYWDEAFLSEDSSRPPVALTRLSPATANLRFRGFSKPLIDPERSQPEAFVYDTVRLASSWNPTPGMYTRYGDVRELLTEIDDRFVIIGSGDEIRLLFDGRSLPALKPGWQRDFLLKVDGWAKDQDANTAFSQTVEPLPFHGMASYPYPPQQQYPRDAWHSAYRRRYNTRPALRLIRPLEGKSRLAED